jgi:hypothetical protein
MSRFKLPDALGGAECTFHAEGYQPGCWIVELVDVMPGLRIEIEPEALTEVPPPIPAQPEPGAYLVGGVICVHLPAGPIGCTWFIAETGGRPYRWADWEETWLLLGRPIVALVPESSVSS